MVWRFIVVGLVVFLSVGGVVVVVVRVVGEE